MPDIKVDSRNLNGLQTPFVAAHRVSTWLLPPSLLEVERLVDNLLASWQPAVSHWDRRHGHRTQFSEAILLTPVDETTGQPCDEPYTVRAKNISPQGMSFLHDAPLPHRNVHLSIPLPTGLCAALLLRLNWCRFTCDGLYESGGRFLRAVLGETHDGPSSVNGTGA